MAGHQYKAPSGRVSPGILGRSPTTQAAPPGPQNPPPAQRKKTGAPAPKQPSLLPPEMLLPGWLVYYPKGIDLSTRWDRKDMSIYDWQEVADSRRIVIHGKKQMAVNDRIHFAILGATAGVGATPHFKRSWNKLKTIPQLVRGAYHWLLLGPNPDRDPVHQANKYLAEVGSFDFSLPPIVDIEDMSSEALTWLAGIDPKTGKINLQLQARNRAQAMDNISKWLGTVIDRVGLGRLPIIYTFSSYWKDTLGNPTNFSEFPLWIAHYDTTLSRPTIPGGWKDWTLWQFAGAGEKQPNDQHVEGIGNMVDLNVFNGSPDQLDRLAGGLMRKR